MPIINDLTFTLQDVVTEVVPTGGNDLYHCFFESTAAKFNPRYAKTGDWLSEFRDYGYDGTITQKDSDSSFSYALESVASSPSCSFIHSVTPYGTGSAFIQAWSVASNGAITKNYGAGLTPFDTARNSISAIDDDNIVIMGDNSYDGGSDDTIVLHTYSYNSGSGYTFNDWISQTYSLNNRNKIINDGTYFITIGRNKFVDLYSIDVLGGLTLEDSYEMNNYPDDIVYADGFVVVVAGTELRSFQVDSINDELDFIDYEALSYAGYAVGGDNNGKLIVFTSNVSPTIGFTVVDISSSGALSGETNDTTSASSGDILCLPNSEMFICKTVSSTLQTFRIDNTDDIVFEETLSSQVRNTCICWDPQYNYIFGADASSGANVYTYSIS